jgi:hypothetical protein
MPRPLLTLLALLILGLPAAAQELDTVTLDAREQPLHAVLAELSRQARVPITLSEGVPNPRVSLNIRDVAPGAALRLLLRVASVEGPRIWYVPDGKGFRNTTDPLAQEPLHPITFKDPDPRLGEKVMLSFRRTPLREALAKLLGPARVDFQVHPQVPRLPVTLEIRQETAFRALQLLFEEARLDFPLLLIGRMQGVYQLGPGANPPPSPTAEGTARARRISLTLREVPLSQALASLFQGTGLQYSVRDRDQPAPVTITLKDSSVWDGLQAIVRSAREKVPFLRVTLRGEVFVVEPARTPVPSGPDRP